MKNNMGGAIMLTLLLCITLLLIGALVDVIMTGMSGYPNAWRAFRHRCGVLTVLMGVTTTVILLVTRKKVTKVTWFFAIVSVAWLFLDLAWPRV